MIQTTEQEKKKYNEFKFSDFLAVSIIIVLAALILSPTIKGFLRDSKISQANQKANTVYSAAQFALIKYVEEHGTYDTKSAATPVCQYSNSSAISVGSSAVLDIQSFLGGNFTGYFAFATTNSGDEIQYALWSKEPFTDIVQQSAKQQENDFGEDYFKGGTKIIGCYPLTDAKPTK